jgi:mRNA-degrading endonuclease RelE of RelBE toxin-antitoxin system
MHEVIFTKKAEKQLNKLARQDSRQIVNHIQKLTFPFPKNYDVKSMNAKGFYRLRVGRVRVILDVDKKEIWIRKVGYRGRIYK